VQIPIDWLIAFVIVYHP